MSYINDYLNLFNQSINFIFDTYLNNEEYYDNLYRECRHLNFEDDYNFYQQEENSLFENLNYNEEEKEEAKEKIISTTKYQTTSLTQETNKKKYFKIKKILKNIELRKNKNQQNYIKPIKHGKSAEDNICIKIKTHFIKNLIIYINNKYKDYLKQKNLYYTKSTKLVQKIKPTFAKASNTEERKFYFNLKIKEILSMELSDRCKSNKDYNKKQIERLYEENDAKEIIEILNKTVKDMYIDYISNNIDEFKFEDDLKNIKKKYENDTNYISKYKKTSIKLIEIIYRNGRQKKNN